MIEKFEVHDFSSGSDLSPISKDSDMNTETIETRNRSVQIPEDTGLSFSSASSSDRMSSQSLPRFLRASSRVCQILIEENNSQRSEKIQAEFESHWDIGSSFLRLFHEDITNGRPIVDIAFSPSDLNTLCACYGKITGEMQTALTKPGMICVWNLASATYPEMVLISEAELTSCCLVPGKPYIVVAGTADGSIHLWDLREENHLHKNYRVGTCKMVFLLDFQLLLVSIRVVVAIKDSKNEDIGYELYPRMPSYSTDWLIADNHFGRIVCFLCRG